ncbi:MAG TPA: hypothetical protein VER33_01200 [Polyangiaceae bacterium]|nr:hypothetical protein [Polyangiaceae bacterium]
MPLLERHGSTLFALLVLLSGCSGPSGLVVSSEGGAGGKGATAGAGGADDLAGTAGDTSDAEYIDEAGQCRRELEPSVFGCPATYDEALTSASSCGFECAGAAQDVLVYLRDCTPTVRCAYDPGSRELIGGYYGDDVPSHCGDVSMSVIAGTFPGELWLSGYDLDRNCSAPEQSVSPLFNDLFANDNPIVQGKACRSSLDRCRGPVRLLVCLNDEGTVLGDGTCQSCRSDADCQTEYPYAPNITCDPAAGCRLSPEAVGACSEATPAACETGAGAFVCIEGVCDRCTSTEDCDATYPGFVNVCEDGHCLRAAPVR